MSSNTKHLAPLKIRNTKSTTMTLMIVAMISVAGMACGNSVTGGEGEESGTQLTLSQTYDQVRSGVRLILRYDATANSFVGTAENTTTAVVTRVRVEVHLSNGIELRPTTPTDLAPAQTVPITLQAPSGGGFDMWSAHPEVG